MSLRLLSVGLETERDVVIARQRARQAAALLGFEPQDQTRIATAVSEIVRNCVRYARHGRVEFSLEGSTAPQVLLICVTDRGGGIPDVAAVLRGGFRSRTGMGIGISGARRLMDGFELASGPDGTRVLLKKLLPRASPFVTPADVARMGEEFARSEPRDVYEEVQRQNQELLRTLDDLRQRQDELQRLNQELADTNRGVVALYAELDERADHLRRADELKTRFLSNMSHEFRTPLNSILALTRLLLDRLDGPLTTEQEHQVRLVRNSAAELLDLVNDLLDLAKVQAGKIVVRPTEFHVQDLFGALRGMLRPLLVGSSVDLVIEAESDLPALHTDEGKVSQILRNLISNALKFTERGEVRVTAQVSEDGERVGFLVADTGIGIAPSDQQLIFEEYSQVEHPIQGRVRGTGLGLPLSRRLATLLGGTLEVESELGKGSLFRLDIPRVHVLSATDAEVPSDEREEPPLDRLRLPVLVVEDDEAARASYEGFLRDTRFQPFLARTLREARAWLADAVPAAVVLDIRLQDEDSWEFMGELETSEHLQDVPVLVATVTEDERKARALGAESFLRKPFERWMLLDELARITGQRADRAQRVLIVDDDPTFRHALRRTLEHAGCSIEEAASGAEGVERIRTWRPELVFLDLEMPAETLDGEAMLRILRDTPATAPLPVVLVSAASSEAGKRLEHAGAAVFVDKRDLSRENLERLLRASDPLADGILEPAPRPRAERHPPPTVPTTGVILPVTE